MFSKKPEAWTARLFGYSGLIGTPRDHAPPATPASRRADPGAGARVDPGRWTGEFHHGICVSLETYRPPSVGHPPLFSIPHGSVPVSYGPVSTIAHCEGQSGHWSPKSPIRPSVNSTFHHPEILQLKHKAGSTCDQGRPSGLEGVVGVGRRVKQR